MDKGTELGRILWLWSKGQGVSRQEPVVGVVRNGPKVGSDLNKIY